jgi:hypothetical protein
VRWIYRSDLSTDIIEMWATAYGDLSTDISEMWATLMGWSEPFDKGSGWGGPFDKDPVGWSEPFDKGSGWIDGAGVDVRCSRRSSRRRCSGSRNRDVVVAIIVIIVLSSYGNSRDSIHGSSHFNNVSHSSNCCDSFYRLK